MNRQKLFPAIFMIFLSVSALAEANTCPAIIDTALRAVDEFCVEATRNQACYGNLALEAEAQPGANAFEFETVGDIVDVSNLRSIQLSDIDPDLGIWGVALMRLQVNIPDTLPGQNVTFLLFGDVALRTDEEAGPDLNPMQAFYLTTGVGMPGCVEAPQGGLLVQSPDGVETVQFTVNGVDVQMGSTVFFEAVPGQAMQVTTVEGSAVLRIGQTLYPIVAGTRMRLPMTESLQAAGLPEMPEAYEADWSMKLPLEALDRPIIPHEPLSEETLTRLVNRVSAGLLPCGEGLPSCARMALYQAPGQLWSTGVSVLEQLPELRPGEIVDGVGAVVNEVVPALLAPVEVAPLVNEVRDAVEEVVPAVVEEVVPAIVEPVQVVAPVVNEVTGGVTEVVEEIVPEVLQPVAPILEIVPTLTAPGGLGGLLPNLRPRRNQP